MSGHLSPTAMSSHPKHLSTALESPEVIRKYTSLSSFYFVFEPIYLFFLRCSLNIDDKLMANAITIPMT